MVVSNSRFKSSMTICLPVSFHPSSSLLCNCSNSFKILFIITTTSLIFTTPSLIFLFCIKNNFHSGVFIPVFSVVPISLKLWTFKLTFSYEYFKCFHNSVQKYPMNLIVASTFFHQLIQYCYVLLLKLLHLKNMKS